MIEIRDSTRSQLSDLVKPDAVETRSTISALVIDLHLNAYNIKNILLKAAEEYTCTFWKSRTVGLSSTVICAVHRSSESKYCTYVNPLEPFKCASVSGMVLVTFTAREGTIFVEMDAGEENPQDIWVST
jgi:hypothetical protein